MGKTKPEWVLVATANNGASVYWCRGCGCLKIVGFMRETRYRTPRRERLRRIIQKNAAARGAATCPQSCLDQVAGREFARKWAKSRELSP